MSEFSESSEEIEEFHLSESGGDGVKSPSVASSTKQSSSEGTTFDTEKASLIVSKLNDRCQELQKVYDSLSTIRRDLTSQICQSMDFIKIAVDHRKDELLKELDSQCDLRISQVKNMLYQFETRMQKLLNLIEVNRETEDCKLLSENEFKLAEKIAGRRGPAMRKEDVKRLLNSPILDHPSETDSLVFFPNDLDKTFAQLKTVGYIGLLSSDPNKTFLENYQENLVRCEIDEKMSVRIMGNDRIGRPVLNMDPSTFSGELKVRESHFTKLRIHHEDLTTAAITNDLNTLNQVNHIRLTYSISNPGLYDLSVKVFGEHIKGSPYIVWCKKPPGPNVQEWLDAFNSVKSSCLVDMFKISSMKRYSSMPRLHFWDFLETRRIAAKENESDFLFSFDLMRSKLDKPIVPSGLLITKDRKIVLIDSNNAQVHIYSDEGKFLLAFGEQGSEPGQLQKPIDVAETINGNYLISDMDNHCVNVFSPKGKYISRFGQRYLTTPKGLVVDSKGRILVADPKSFFVCIFKPTGKFVNRFGVRGNEDNQFLSPSYLAVNQHDEIIVSDNLQNRIKVFDSNGLFLYAVGENGMVLGQLHNPCGIALDKSGRIYVCDQGNSRVQILNKDGTFHRKILYGQEILESPVSIALLPDASRLYVCDTNLQKIFAFFCDTPTSTMGGQQLQQQSSNSLTSISTSNNN